MIDTGFGISFDIIRCPEGTGIQIRNNLTKREEII